MATRYHYANAETMRGVRINDRSTISQENMKSYSDKIAVTLRRKQSRGRSQGPAERIAVRGRTNTERQYQYHYF